MLIGGNGGHCPGIDPGAIGPTGLQEAFVVEDVTRKFLHYVSQVGYETLFIQDDSLSNICNIANSNGVDLLVSFHANAHDNPGANGMEIFTSRGNTQSDSLATYIMNQMKSEFPQLYVRADYSDGDVDKEAGFQVLTGSNMPAVLVELAFITNPVEEAMLWDENIRDAYARAIARGVTDYVGSL